MREITDEIIRRNRPENWIPIESYQEQAARIAELETGLREAIRVLRNQSLRITANRLAKILGDPQEDK